MVDLLSVVDLDSYLRRRQGNWQINARLTEVLQSGIFDWFTMCKLLTMSAEGIRRLNLICRQYICVFSFLACAVVSDFIE